MERVYQEIREKILAGESDYNASGTPVSAIREVQPDGTELWIGDIGFIRSSYHEVEDETERERLVDGKYSSIINFSARGQDNAVPER